MTTNDERGAFIWYELATTDIAGAKAFYDAVVGWTIDSESAIPGGAMDYRMIGRSDGGRAGGVMQYGPDAIAGGAKSRWFGYVQVADVDAAADKVVDAGGALHMGPVDMAGVGRMAMVADPQGAMIYLMKPTPPADNPDAKSDVYNFEKAQHVRWNELWTSDQAAAVALYGELFGWTQEGAMPMGAMGDYLFIQHDGGGIGAIGRAQPGGEGARWQYFLGVDDIDRAIKAVNDGGGELIGDPQQIPGGEFTVYGHDPQGATFGLVGPRKE